MRKEKPLEDLDPMPWGMHANRPMQDVPARYFHWLWTKPGGLKSDPSNPVADYIKRNMRHLQTEHPDGIWD